MKTGKYYFSLLSDEEQVLFRDNLVSEYSAEEFERYILDEYPKFESFIWNSFDWGKAPQGHVYWENISRRQI